MFSIIRRCPFTVVPILLLSACVSNSRQPSLAQGESIYVSPPIVKHFDVSVDSRSVRAGKGAALGVVGVVGGAAVGGVAGAIFGLGCGPLAFVCSPLFAAAGVGVGGVGGGIVGAGYGGRGGISGDKAKLFNEATERLFNKSVIETQLGKQFVEQADKYWIVENDSPNIITIYLKSLRFEQTSGEHVQLIVHAEMKVQLDSGTGSFEFDHIGKTRYVDDWLANDGESLQLEVDAAIQMLAHGMVEKLVGVVTRKATTLEPRYSESLPGCCDPATVWVRRHVARSWVPRYRLSVPESSRGSAPARRCVIR